jgi:hypothetical protein
MRAVEKVMLKFILITSGMTISIGSFNSIESGFNSTQMPDKSHQEQLEIH